MNGICVIGNLNIDLILRGVPHPPAWGTEVAAREHLAVTAGQAGNLALALARLGAPPSLVGNVGGDHFGRQILDDLAAAGVSLDGVERHAAEQTGISIGLVRDDGERAFASSFAHLHRFTASLVLKQWPTVERAGIVCLVGLFCLPGLPLDDAIHLLSRARAEGKATMLDTGWDPQGWPAQTIQRVQALLRQTTMFMPNRDEALAITGATTVDEAAATLCRLGPELVVIKCGADGCYVRQGSRAHQLQALPARVYDTVGAGDTFDAGFLLSFQRGCDIQACMACGNAAASLYIARATNRFPSAGDVATAAAQYGITLSDLGDNAP